MFKLEVRESDQNPLVFLLKEGTYSVGRNSDNDIVLVDSSVSRSHCLIFIKSNYAEIEDLSSANGVMVDGERIGGRVEIKRDVEFLIGESRAYLRADDFENASETTIFHRGDLKR